MAHVKTIDFRDTFLFQCAKGYRSRSLASVGFSVANDRGSNTAPARIMAKAIRNETEVIPVFTAPCAGRVIRIFVNGSPYADMDVDGTVTVTVTKAVIGGTDADLCSAVTVGSEPVPTLDTAIDATLTAANLDLVEGQHVYATVVVSDYAVETAVAYISINVEWVPIEQ